MHLVQPRAMEHFWDDLSGIILWQLIPFNGFTQPFVKGKLWKALKWEKYTITGCFHLRHSSRWSLLLTAIELIFNFVSCRKTIVMYVIVWRDDCLLIIASGCWPILHQFSKFISTFLIACICVYSSNSSTGCNILLVPSPVNLIE